MKKVIPALILSLIAIYRCNAQNLVNSKKDTLQNIAFSNSTLKDKTEFQFTLQSGLYFLIFDVGVDQDSLTLDINRPYDSPTLYRKHNGYYSFEIQHSSVVNFNINYYGKLDSSGLFAKLYWETEIPTPIGTPYPRFTVKDINGQAFKPTELTGCVTLFFLWDPDSKSGKEYYELLNELAADFGEVSFVAWARFPSKVRKFRNQYSESNFRFVAEKWQKLGQWTKVIGGAIILIVNKEGQLEYKNRIFEDHAIFKVHLKESVREKLNELI